MKEESNYECPWWLVVGGVSGLQTVYYMKYNTIMYTFKLVYQCLVGTVHIVSVVTTYLERIKNWSR